MAEKSLIADIGATNARFALVGADGEARQVRVLACDDHPSFEEAVAAYLHSESETGPLTAAGLAIAGPVASDRVALTNHPWTFSLGDLRRRFALERLLVVNDFVAVACAIPFLSRGERDQVGGGEALSTAPIGALGPGSGLGVSSLAWTGDCWLPIAGEGGHVTMPPTTAREGAVLADMRRRFDHVSAERVLSGPGLVHLYETLAELDGVPAKSFSPTQIADAGIRDNEPHCREAVEMFCAMLGTIAGNLALTLGARGGIYIAGGIVPKLGALISASLFRTRFEDKGRMQPLLSAVPTYVISHPFPAFLGLVHALLPAGRVRLIPGTNCAESRQN